MRLLDLFCGAGGGAAGYAMWWPDAEIMGVDIVNQPDYPFFFAKRDAMTFPVDARYQLIHASPPCQDHSRAQTTHPKHGTGWMLAATVERLHESGTHWVVENVASAKMPPSPHSVMLCGSMFGLDVRRHRKFATSFPVEQPPCRHDLQTGSFPTLDYHKRIAGKMTNIVGVHGEIQYKGELEVRRKAMGIDWMASAQLAQAIPPAYTRYIAEWADKVIP